MIYNDDDDDDDDDDDGDDDGVVFKYYSQTDFANFRRNIGILIDSLSRTSCNLRE